MNYERGFRNLERILKGVTPSVQAEFQTQIARHRKHEEGERIFGPSENSRREFAEIQYSLNVLTLRHFERSFNDLCGAEDGDTKGEVDVGIIVALQEEFQEIFPQIRVEPVHHEDISQYFYRFQREHSGGKEYSCVIAFAGGMGEKAAILGERLMERYRPKTIVIIGIAGSLDKDVLVGDVVVAEQADDYLYAAKAVAGKGRRAFEFELSGDPYKSSPAYVSDAKNLGFTYPKPSESWLEFGRQGVKELIDDEVREKLLNDELIREQPFLHTGNIASGPIVGATERFVKWLKKRDRKYLAIEMEAAGVMRAAHTRSTDTLIIRGISDYSDARKGALDNIGGGALRRLAMRNAIALLLTFMDLQMIKHSN